MKKTLILVAAIFTLVGCNNEQEEILPKRNPVKEQCIQKEELASLLINSSIDLQTVSEMHKCVTAALEEGKEEQFALSDIQPNGKTKFTGTSFLVEKIIESTCLQNAVSDSKQKTYDTETLVSLLQNSDLQIYWPYSEDWDGKELPTIVVAPSGKHIEEAMGMPLSPDGKATQASYVLVNEDYAMTHPVWIIKVEQKDPFVQYIPRKARNTNMVASAQSTNPLYVWKLTKMKVTHQYDSLMDGGSEIDVQAAYPALTGYTGMVTKHRVHFSRKEIRTEKEKSLDLILNTNWREEQITNCLLVTEHDGGDPMNINMSTTFVNPDTNQSTTLTVTAQIQDDDDFIDQLTLDRDYVLRHENLSLTLNGNVYMTVPIVIE